MVNKKKIVFLVSFFYPKPTANGVCVKLLGVEFLKRGYDVHVICMNNGKDTTDEVIDGIKIHRINKSLYKICENQRESSNNNVYKKFLKLVSMSIKLIHYSAYPLTSLSLVRRYIHKFNEIVGTNNCILVSCFNPLEAVYAGMKIKLRNENVFNVGYYLDSLTNEGEVGIIEAKKRNKKGFRWEQRMFDNSDLILLMENHRRHYSSDEYAPYKPKIRFTEIPFLSKQYHDDTVAKDMALYVGMVNTERRNPEYACKVLSYVLKGYSIEFYGRGDCVERLENFGENIKYGGFVSHEEAMQLVRKAKILISIGNKNSDMIPSKLFEYISTGKIIIHFIYDDRDPCIPYLNRYSNGIIVDMRLPYDKSMAILMDALKESHDIIDFETIEVRFKKNLPGYTCDIIEQLVKD